MHVLGKARSNVFTDEFKNNFELLFKTLVATAEIYTEQQSPSPAGTATRVMWHLENAPFCHEAQS